jgi:hypothetical protein
MFGSRSSLLWLVIVSALSFSLNLAATPPLTTISDTLFNADGTLFNGVVTVTWPSFEASDTSNVAAQNLNVHINNGVLYVRLVPTTNAHTAAVYTIQYSSFGVTQFSEAWAVPPSTIPLRVRDVRLSPGSVSGSAPAVATIIGIGDITGLQNALNVRPVVGTTFGVSRTAVIDSTGAIDAAPGEGSDCVHVDGSSGPCGSGGSVSGSAFIDAEIPSGTMNGSNPAFALANVPSPASSLTLFRNGLLLAQGADYTVSLNGITFQPGASPQPGDLLTAYYRRYANLPGVGFVDQETPAGAVNGVNTTFTLGQTPLPAASLAVYRNGLRMSPGTDYTVSGTVITFAAVSVPQASDALLCSYRFAQ